MLEACFSAAQGLSGPRCLKSRVRTPSGGFRHFRIYECQRDPGSWGKPLEPKTSPNPPERLLATNNDVSSFNRSKEITGSTQTRSRRSSRPAVGVAAGYCCRIAAPPRRRRQRWHWSCVRACECVRVGRYTYMITRTGSGSPLALNLCTARAWEWRGG